MRLHHAVICFFAVVVLSLTLVTVPSAAQDVEELTLDASSCEVLGGVWDASASQCVLETGGELTEGQALTIPEDVSLWVFAGRDLVNYGDILNFGEIANDGTVNNYGSITNEGTFENRKGRAILGTLYNYGLFANQGTLTNDGLIDNRGTFTSDSLITGEGTIQGTIDYLTVEEVCAALDRFIQQINALSGGLITEEQAAQIVANVDEDKEVLACP